MEAYEHILPENETIDKKVELQRSELESKFQISIAEAGDILDLNHENIRPTEKFLEFSSIVAKTLIKDGDPEAIRDAIYRSVCFGAQICDYLLPSEYTCNLPEYINKRTDEKASIAPMVEDSQGYLARRPHLNQLLTDHMSDIDRSERYDGVVSLFGGLVIMLAERSIGRQYADTSIQGLDTRDFQ